MNWSDEVFEGNCSKQMHQQKKTIFQQLFCVLCLHEGDKGAAVNNYAALYKFPITGKRPL